MSEPKKILIVEDDLDLVASIQLILERQGYEIHTASNIKDANAVIQRIHPDLGIFDIIMDTKLDGMNLLNTVKNSLDFKDMPVILMSGLDKVFGVRINVLIEDENVFKNVSYINKPFDLSEMVALVDKYLK